jgi:hypothetical protein
MIVVLFVRVEGLRFCVVSVRSGVGVCIVTGSRSVGLCELLIFTTLGGSKSNYSLFCNKFS